MITVQLPTEISYWGSTATESDIDRILTNMETMIRNEFCEAPFEIRFERVEHPKGSGVHGDNEDACLDVHAWIESNWTMAL